MTFLNPNPPNPQQIVSGQFYYSISTFTKRGGPGSSFDKYYVDMHVSEGIRVVDGKTTVVVGSARAIPIEEIFLTKEDAEKVCPEDKVW